MAGLKQHNETYQVKRTYWTVQLKMKNTGDFSNENNQCLLGAKLEKEGELKLQLKCPD